MQFLISFVPCFYLSGKILNNAQSFSAENCFFKTTLRLFQGSTGISNLVVNNFRLEHSNYANDLATHFRLFRLFPPCWAKAHFNIQFPQFSFPSGIYLFKIEGK